MFDNDGIRTLTLIVFIVLFVWALWKFLNGWDKDERILAPTVRQRPQVAPPVSTTKPTARPLTSRASSSKNEQVPKRVEPKAKPAPTAQPLVARPATPRKPDDLTKIEGIGPKIQSILHGGNIKTFRDLAETNAESVRAMLTAADNRYRMHDPTTWATQAKIAAKGDWEKLDDLQNQLKGGRPKG